MLIVLCTFQAVVALAVCATVVAAEAEADASHLYGGYGYGAVASLGYGGYNGVHATPAYGYSAALGYGAGYGYAGHFIGKREAEADASLAYGYAPLAYAYNPIWYAPRASSYQQIATPFSVSSVHQIHKREADAEASVAYGYAPLAYAYGPGIAAHPGYATSFEHRSPQGLHSLYRPYGHLAYAY